MTKTVTIRLDDPTYEEFREAAEAENRPISNLIETAALAKIRAEQFVDDVEMAEIRSNERLLESLERGSKDATNKKGRFIG